MKASSTFLLSSVALLALGTGCKKKDEAKVTPPAGSAAPVAPVAAGSGSAAAAAAGSGSAAAPAAPAGQILLKDVGFSTPESVLYAEADDVYLVSNIDGTPLAADGNGFISRVSPEGKVTELKWIEGGKNDVALDAPKGMAISGDVLWVADIANVRKFDAKTGKPVGSVKIDGAEFLNDVTPDGAGGIYVSDMAVTAEFKPTGNDAIYRVGKDDKVSTFAKSKDLGSPNGIIAADGGALWVVSFVSGEVYSLDATGQRTAGGDKPPKGQLDGIVALPGGEVLVSSWEGQAVYRGSGRGEWKEIVTGAQAPADIGWDSKRKQLLIPRFMDNQVQIVPVE